MQIQINTDHNIKGRESLVARLSSVIENALSRISGQITRVEVHLSDENGDKRGEDDIRCMMEARLEGRQPIAVTCQAANVDQAVDGATDKLISMIENILGKRRDHKHGRTDPPLPEQNITETS